MFCNVSLSIYQMAGAQCTIWMLGIIVEWTNVRRSGTLNTRVVRDGEKLSQRDGWSYTNTKSKKELSRRRSKQLR